MVVGHLPILGMDILVQSNNRNIKKSEVCRFTRSKTPPCVFFMLFKLYRWYHASVGEWFLRAGLKLGKDSNSFYPSCCNVFLG